MEVDIEDLTNVKKRKSCFGLPHQKKKLYLSAKKPDVQREKSCPKGLSTLNKSLPATRESKENNEACSSLSTQQIEENSTSAKSSDEEFLHVFHRSQLSNKVLKERKLNSYFKRLQENECNLKRTDTRIVGGITENSPTSTVTEDLNIAFLEESDTHNDSSAEGIPPENTFSEENTVQTLEEEEKNLKKLEIDENISILSSELDENDDKQSAILSKESFSNTPDKNPTNNIKETVKIKTSENADAKCNEVIKDDNSPEDLNNHFDGSFGEWDFSEMVCPDASKDLDLGSWQRCKVISVEKDIQSKNKILELQSILSGDTSKCVLSGVWTFCNIQSGSIVNVKAHYLNSKSTWVIDDLNGFLVEYPDTLVSPTTIVGSISCMRQGVLNNLISKVDRVENSKLLVSGSLIHELLQQVLSEGNNSPEFIATIIEEIISSPYNIRLLYSSKMSMCEARSELLKAVPNVHKFCEYYSVFCSEKSYDSLHKIDVAWRGKIKSVIAIEDNYWIPQLGLKGKVDVMVSALEHMQSQEILMPVEVKTGSAKNSVEHRGQVILYCLMAAQVTPEVEAGLLLYLKEGFARKVHVGRREQRDIVLLRNQLVKYLMPQPSTLDNLSLGNIVLPDPTGSSQACKWCPHMTICAAFLRVFGEEKLYIKTKAQDLRSSSLVHLLPEHIDYVVHWCKLLWAEESDKPEDSLKNLWTTNPEDREKNGMCASNLLLCLPVNCNDVNSYMHLLKKKNENDKFDFNSYQFSTGQIVLVSTDVRLAIAFGTIIEVNCNTLTVDVPRDLSQHCNLYGSTFVIDIYEPKTNINWCIGNLAALLDDRDDASRMRRLIIDQDKPLFDTECESLELNLNSSTNLNTSQQIAIKKALATQDYLLIRGFPGSGKTYTVATLIHQLVARGQSVLLTAHTHSAVDTVLLKLLTLKVDFVRIGAASRIHPAIHPWSEQNLTKHCCTPEQLETAYNEKPVVAVTCWGVKHTLFSRRRFDVCIVDESTQVLQPVIIGPLLRAEKFILVGDPEQLPPVVKSKIASKEGLSKCMFTRLDSSETSVSLDIQYRMNSKITELANNLTYGGQLKCASPDVANATLSIASQNIKDSQPPWIIRSLCCKLEASVIFINVSKLESSKSRLINKDEALVIKKLVEAFTNHGIQSDAIGIIAPYREQVKYLQSEIFINQKIDINTVDQYQGRDKDIVIFSCTNNWSIHKSSNHDAGILNDKRRMTVAVTRAKVKFIMIGNKQTLQAFAPIKLLIDYIDPSNMFEVKQ